LGHLTDFLAVYPNMSTRNVYRSEHMTFFDCIFTLVSLRDINLYEPYADRYFCGRVSKETPDTTLIMQDLMKFAPSRAHRAPGTQAHTVSGVANFLGFYWVELTVGQRQKVAKKCRGRKPIAEDTTLTRDLIRTIMADSLAKLATIIGPEHISQFG